MANPWELYAKTTATPVVVQSPIDTAISTEAKSPEETEFLKSIFMQESSGGRNTKTSNQGAVGIGQIQPGTFKEVADKGWDINNPYHNAQASARYALKHFRNSDGNTIVAAAGYYGGPGGAAKAKNGQAVSDRKNPDAPDTIEYGKEVAKRLPPWQQYSEAIKLGASTMLSGGLANMQGTVDTVKQGVTDLATKLTGDKYDKMELQLKDLEAAGVSKAKIAKFKSDIDELRKNDPSSRASIEDMPNFMPHDIPPLNFIIPAFAKTALGKEMYKVTRGVPYLESIGTGFTSDKPSKMDIAAGRTLDKFKAGTEDLGNMLKGMVTSYTSPEEFQKSLDARAAIKEDQALKDKVMTEFNLNPGTGGMIGDMLPYLLTGEYVGKPLIKGAGKVTNAIADIPAQAATKGKGLIARAVDKAAVSNVPVLNTAGKMAQTEFTGPWAERALHNTRANAPWESLFKAHGGNILGPALLGAAESGLHYDQSMGEGALSSIIGQKMGDVIGPWLTRGTDYRAKVPGEADLRDFAYKEGWNATPGDDLGNQFYQRFEAGLRNNGNYADRLKQFDVADVITRNQSVFEGMGIPRKSIDALTPEALVAHEQNLKSQYKKLVDGTVGQFDYNDRNTVRNHLAKVAKNTTEEGIKAAKEAQYYADQINKTMGVQRNALGQIQPSIINGEEFQTLRSDLKGEISAAWNKGDRTKAKALQPLLDVLDGSIEKGIAKGKGDPTANIAAWRELNRKWAVTEAVKQHGLTDLGSFDPIKFANHAMSADNSRYLMETGGPEMNKIFQWSKHAKMRKENAGSDLGGMGVHAESLAPKRTLLNTLIQPFNVNTPLTDPFLRSYLAGWPAKTGLLNMSGKKFGDPRLYTRAYSASQQPWPTLYHKTEDALTDAIKNADDIKREIIEALTKKKAK